MGIVWTNVAIFVVGHFLFFYAYWSVYYYQLRPLYTWLYCKSKVLELLLKAN